MTMFKTKESKQFGKSLSKVLEYQNISQRDFAKRVGLTPAAINQIVKGKREPSLSSVIKIVDAVYPTFEEMITGEV